jgi:phenylalanine ammonia-lyase
MEPMAVVLRGEGLTIPDLVRVARERAPVKLDDDPARLGRIELSCKYIDVALDRGESIYGVTTGFGGMANIRISRESASDLQSNLVWMLKTGAGRRLANPHVRAAMALRANSHLKGVSGIRLEIIRRLETFLNENVTPHVREFGSIGASGDLVPLGTITGALIGADRSFTVDFNGEQLDSITALERLGLPRLKLRPKEGLAMVNGTSVMTGMAALCVHDARLIIALAVASHALMMQALTATNQSFHPFIHDLKPHPGQVWAAAKTLELLSGSRMIRDELDGRHEIRQDDLIQDRYSLRCLPQYVGPLVDGVATVGRQIEVEMNSANDNPLIDGERQVSYHGGNFLGQYVGMGMDHLRHYLGLLAKHLDIQIALLVAPEFNRGLSPSLVGNTERAVNAGLKGMQLTGNSIMPLIMFFGNSLVDRFPSHAEQFNQNVSSQGMESALLARQSIDTFHQYLAIVLIFAVQAVDLRSQKVVGHYDARACLSPATRPIYEAVKKVVGVVPSGNRPYIWNDDDQSLESHIEQIASDISRGGIVPQAVEQLALSLQ